MELMTKRRLIQWRVEIGASQTELAENARLRQSTISKLESGRPVTVGTQWQIFYALNRLRIQAGFPEIAFDEIDWPT
jgi:transcriptional regulator with XRE-family HTH domain